MLIPLIQFQRLVKSMLKSAEDVLIANVVFPLPYHLSVHGASKHNVTVLVIIHKSAPFHSMKSFSKLGSKTK